MIPAKKFIYSALLILAGIIPLIALIENWLFGYGRIYYLLTNYLELGFFSLGVFCGVQICRT